MISVSCGGFTLLCELNEDGESVVVTGFEGLNAKLEIPGSIEAEGRILSVSAIGRKAFLGCKGLKEVKLSQQVESIDDWGFSQCIHLVRVEASCENISFGKNVFEGCNRLETIEINGCGEDTGRLLAAAVCRLPAAYLLTDKDKGSEEWFKRYDLSLKAFLDRDDFEGYSDRALCGEEDISYDGIGSVDGELLGESESYLREVGKNKAGLVLQRLKHCRAAEKETIDRLESYVNQHAFGTRNPSAWNAIKEDYKNDTEYLKLYLDVTNPTAETIGLMLENMGSDMAQAKAFLIKRTEGDHKTDAFFCALLL